MLSSTMKKYMRYLVKIYFGLSRIQMKFWINVKLEISMRPICLLMIFLLFTLTALPHNLIKDKLIDLIERTFNRESTPYLTGNDRNAFFNSENPKNIMHGLVKIYVMRWHFVGQHFYSIWHQVI